MKKISRYRKFIQLKNNIRRGKKYLKRKKVKNKKTVEIYQNKKKKTVPLRGHFTSVPDVLDFESNLSDTLDFINSMRKRLEIVSKKI